MKLHRFLSFFLCVMLVVSMLPVSALAEEAAAENLLGGGITLLMIEENVPIPEEVPVAEDAPVIEETPVAEEETSVSVDAPVLDGAASGTCGAKLTWTLDDEGTLTISGTGAMTDYDSVSSLPWYSARKSITNVVITPGVLSIGENAFYYCTNLTSITLPDGLNFIGECAFCYCSSLTSITIPDSVTSIGWYAFRECSNLTSITLPDSLVTLGGEAFYKCSSLTSITIPDSVTAIETYTFYKCSNLASITLPNSVTFIGSRAFDSCSNLTDVYYGGSQDQWGNIAVATYNTPLTNATIHYTDPESSLTLANAQHILDFTVGITALSDAELAIADINGDKCIDARDATQILRILNKLSSILDKTE